MACCQLENREAAVVYLGTFAVCPQRQGQGLGGWLIEQAERAAAKTFLARTIEITVPPVVALPVSDSLGDAID